MERKSRAPLFISLFVVPFLIFVIAQFFPKNWGSLPRPIPTQTPGTLGPSYEDIARWRTCPGVKLIDLTGEKDVARIPMHYHHCFYRVKVPGGVGVDIQATDPTGKALICMRFVHTGERIGPYLHCGEGHVPDTDGDTPSTTVEVATPDWEEAQFSFFHS